MTDGDDLRDEGLAIDKIWGSMKKYGARTTMVMVLVSWMEHITIFFHGWSSSLAKALVLASARTMAKSLMDHSRHIYEVMHSS